MTGSTDWLSAAAMLLSGLIVGFMFMYASMRRKQQAAAASAAAPADDLEFRDLEARRDALIQQLRELEDVPANANERTRLEREAAQVLRSLDRTGQTASRPINAPKPAPQTGMNPAVKGFIWGVASVGALGFLAYFVWSQAGDRASGKTTSTPNAMQPASMQQQSQTQPQQSDPAVQQLEAAVAGAPDDVEARINLAKAYLERDNMMGVFEQTQAVLAKSPAEPRALTYQALVRMSMGQTDVAAKMLTQATNQDPKLVDAWVGTAWLDFQTGKREEGEKAMAEAMKQRPEQQARLAEILSQMRKQKPAATAAASDSIHLTINLDPAAAAHTTPRSVLFIIARAAGVTSGPPAAVKRLPPSGFPIEIDISSADSMMGQPLPPKVRLEARLDSDGDATTKSPTDPVAVLDDVAVGAKVTLNLK